jgi:hypothetical protein
VAPTQDSLLCLRINCLFPQVLGGVEYVGK